MKTLNGGHSLLLWDQNRNNVNYFQPQEDKYLDSFIKDQVVKFFTMLRVHPSYKFSKAWEQTLRQFRKEFKSDFKTIVENKGNNLPEDYERVLNKLVGNIGEIFAEYFFTRYGSNWIDIEEPYEPIDPTQEDYTDAKAIASDGLPVFIQVKNWTGEIDSQVIWKASFEDILYLRNHPEQASDYLKFKRQIVFTFTEEKFSFRKEDFDKVVEVIGPKEIDTQIGKPENKDKVCQKILSKIR